MISEPDIERLLKLLADEAAAGQLSVCARARVGQHAGIRARVDPSQPQHRHPPITSVTSITNQHHHITAMLHSHLPPLPILLAIVLFLRPVVAQTGSSGSFIPTVPATAAVPTATASSTLNSLLNTSAQIVCPARYHDCAVVSRPEACCALDQVCVFDDSGMVACCPFRTVCVGKLDASGVKRNAPPPALGGLMSPSLAVGVVAVGAVYWARGQLMV